MELNSTNFDPAPFEAAIKNADYVTMDCEFSGLSLSQKDQRHGFDSTEDIYLKMKDLCSTFFAFQIGICAFNWDSENSKYLASPFNFYVFPSSKFKNERLTFQSSTLTFLTENNMQWDTVFQKGLHYWQRNRKSELVDKVNNYFDSNDTESRRHYWNRLGGKSDEDREEIIQHVKEFLDKPTKAKESLEVRPNRNRACWMAAVRDVKNLCWKRGDSKVRSAKDKTITITKYPPSEESQAKSQSIKDTDSNKSDSSGPDEGMPAKNITQEMEELKLDPDEETKKEINDTIKSEYGFTHIIDKLIEAKKPIIGHNMIFDIMFLYRQFIDDLPKSYDEFVKGWTNAFPVTYDTKLMSSFCGPMKKTWLKAWFDQCNDHPSLNTNVMFDFHPDFKMYADKAQEHEAAYDAYMTGVVFASIAKQKEVIHEFHGILERNDNYQKLMRKKYDAQGYDERNSIMDSIDALSDEVMKSWREETKNRKIQGYPLVDFENKVVVIANQNRVFYFGNNEREQHFSKNMKIRPEKVMWVKLNEGTKIDKIFEAAKDLGDIHMQKDDNNAFYVEFQTIYNYKYKIKDLIEIFREKLGPDCMVTDFESAEKYVKLIKN